MSTTLYVTQALGNKNDLITPTVAQGSYPLGYIYEEYDDSKTAINKYMYVKSHTTLTQYQPYVVTNNALAGSEWMTAAPVTTASAVVLVCWPQVAFTSGYYGFVQIAGNFKSVIPTSTGLGAGAGYKLTNAATALATASSTAPTLNTCAFLVTNTTGTTGSMFAPGVRCEITT